jgi:hypothetical protein
MCDRNERFLALQGENASGISLIAEVHLSGVSRGNEPFGKMKKRTAISR